MKGITLQKILGIIALGYVLALFARMIGVDFYSLSMSHTSQFDYLLYALLCIGLYGSVHGINLEELKAHKSTLTLAITVGIIFKSLFVGLLFYFISGNILAFLLGTILCPIDPLTVAALVKKDSKAFSEGAKSLLRSWAAFDDPIVAVLAIYLIFPIVNFHINGVELESGFVGYFAGLGGNFLLTGSVYVIYLFLKKSNKLLALLLFLSLIIAIYFKLTLGIALIGLFLRPAIEGFLSYLIPLAYYIVALILGALLLNGFNFFDGFILALLAIAAEMSVVAIIGRRLSRNDRIYLSTALQKGISAMVLSLFFEPMFPGIIAITGTAILTLNIIYFTLSKVLNKSLDTEKSI